MRSYELALHYNPKYVEARWGGPSCGCTWETTTRRAGANTHPCPRWQRKESPPRRFSRLPGTAAFPRRPSFCTRSRGLGHTIQFVRYASRWCKERGGNVFVECQPTLSPLLASCPGIDRLIEQENALPDFNLHAPHMSLPGILGTTLAKHRGHSLPHCRPGLRRSGVTGSAWPLA